jgi:hypothetical protein
MANTIEQKIETASFNGSDPCANGNVSNKKALVLSVVLVASLLAIAFTAFTPAYRTNDDVGLSLLVSGCGWTLNPEPKLMFSNALIGIVLSFLYGELPSIPWYGFYLLSVSLLGLLAVSFGVLKRRIDRWAIIGLGFFYAVFGLNALVSMQFTVASYLAGLGGFTLLLSSWEQQLQVKENRCITTKVLALLLLWICSLVRLECFFMVLVVGALVLGLRSMDKQVISNCKNLLSPVLLLSISCLLAFGSKALSDEYYRQSPDSEEVLKRDLIRNFADYGYGFYATGEQIKELNKANGWSQNDLLLIQNLFCLDSRTFSNERLQIASQFFENTHKKSKAEMLALLKVVFSDPIVVPSLEVLLLLFIFAGSKGFSRKKTFSLAAAVFMLSAWLLYDKKLPAWVYCPLWGSVVLAPIIYWRDRAIDSALNKRLLTVLSLATLTLVSIQSFKYWKSTNKRICTKNSLLRIASKEIQSSAPSILFTWREFYPYDAILPFDDVHKYFGNIRVIPFGLRANDHIAGQMFKKLGLSLDNFSGTLCRPDVLIASRDEQNLLLQKYLLEHYKIHARPELVKDYQALGFGLFRFQELKQSQKAR